MDLHDVVSGPAQRVDQLATTMLEAERARWRAVDPDLDALLEGLQVAVLNGGKRIRPVLCHWGWVCAGGDPDDETARAPVVRVGLAFELLHAFALVHDDVMDDAATRRGAPTTHVRFGQTHTRSAWRGQPRRFGESVAILVGDLAHVFADQLVGDLSGQTQALWHAMQLELVAGQYLDVLGTARGRASEGQSRLIARMKSGRYSIVAPLRVGASLVGGAGPDTAMVDASMLAFGEPLGVAFQLRDDLLGAFGDPLRLGKPVGADLREGKPTVLLAVAWARADADQRASLERIGQPDLADREVAELQVTVEATGAREAVEDEIVRLTRQAHAALVDAPIPDQARQALMVLADFVATRTH